jgi:hypothetical protein
VPTTWDDLQSLPPVSSSAQLHAMDATTDAHTYVFFAGNKSTKVCKLAAFAPTLPSLAAAMPCELAVELLRLYAKGELAATQVQRLAAAGHNDGWGRTDELATRLATAGDNGAVTGNIARDIMRAAKAAGMLASSASLYFVKLPDGKDLAMYLPHEVAAHTVEGDDLQQWCLDGDTLAREEGLGRLLRDWAAHRDVAYGGDLTSVLIAGVYGDAVQYTSTMRAGGARSIYVCSMNFISARDQSRRARRHPLFVLPRSRLCKCCNGYHTFQAIFAVIAWSFQQLLLGTSPSRRHDDAAFSRNARTHESQRDLPSPFARCCSIAGIGNGWLHRAGCGGTPAICSATCATRPCPMALAASGTFLRRRATEQRCCRTTSMCWPV